MFSLYQHHDLRTLADLLAALRERSRPRSPLTPDTVIVPNRGTGRWLQAQLAGSAGIAANLDLPVPGRFVWQTLRDTLPGEPDSSDYERERLVWHLYALLPTVDVPEVRRYLAAAPVERHRYQLAARLADVFDAYLVHRRDVLVQWEAGREAGEPPAAWQAPVWRALVARAGAQHRARLLTDFLGRARAGDLDASRLPDPVYAVALVDLPPDYLRLLHALGDYVDVHFLLPNPSSAYWGDLRREPVRRAALLAADDAEAGHPLLASLGRAGRDLLRVLYDDEFASLSEPDLGPALAPDPPGDGCLLHRVQSGLIAGDAPVREAGVAADDRSIQVHACHGPLREMQVLHDRLLDLLSHWPDLEPRDILVLLPDVATYAPAVHSVFGGAGDDRHIPYRVANTPRRDTHPIARTVQQLVELPLSRWTASEVLALAGVPAVMRRFDLDEGDLALLARWVPAAGVRWGLDRASRAEAGGADFGQNTWQFGLDRLLLGLAQQDETALVDGVAPWSDLEGGPAAAVGRLWGLVDRLRAWRDRLTEAATAAQWQERLNAMVDELIAIDTDDPAEEAALATVREAVGTLEGAAASLGDETVSWEAVREALLGALAGGGQRQPLVSGGVTFAGLEPLRGVPFEVIAMVGMDDGVFPRQDGQRAFNLLQQSPRTGDPSIRDAERMGFLQALTSARRCFYLSYTGRDLADGEPLQPSPVVGEFLDFLHGHEFAGWSDRAFRDALITEAPLHPFSPACFPVEAGDRSTFVADWRAAAAAQRGERRPPAPFIDGTRLPEPGTAVIDLAELKRFYRHPPAWFFSERLGLMLAETDERMDDDEPRGLDGLGRHELRTRLFERATRAGATALDTEPDALERARGHLPPPPLGGAEYADAATAVNHLLPLHWAWQAEAPEPASVAVDLNLGDGARLVGRVTGVANAALRRLRAGDLRLKHLLPWWLDYLAVVAGGHAVTLEVAGAGVDGLDHRMARLEPADARALLATAVDWFRTGTTRPLLFEPYIAEHYLGQLAKRDRSTGAPKTPDAALASTNGWLSNAWQPPPAAGDAWLQPLFQAPPTPLGTDAAGSDLAVVAAAVAQPLRERLGAAEAGE